MKANKDEFVITRVTRLEKQYLRKEATLAGIKKLSRYIRIKLGLEKPE